MGQLDRLLAAISVLLVFLYVVLRAMYVPTFHDEAATFFHYIVSEKFLPYQAHWDANNHLLNSALAYYCYKWWGTELIWIRLPNVLSFLIYGYFAFKLSAGIKSNSTRWLTFIALLTAAFPLEFFSQARGYGMSLAFLLGAVHHTHAFLVRNRLRNHLLLWFWMGCAVAANMALINAFAIFLGIVIMHSVLNSGKRVRNLITVLVMALPLLAMAVMYALELKERGLLYTGFPDGFVKITVGSLMRHQFGITSLAVAWSVAMVGLSASLYLVGKLVTTGFCWTMGRLAAALLLLNALASITLNLLMGVNFPEDRVGVYFFPLFILTCMAAVDELATRAPRAHWLAFVSLIFPLHLLLIANLNTTLLWPPWHVSEGTYLFALDKQKDSEKPLMISSHYLNELGWSFWNFRNGGPMQPLQRRPVPDTLADLLIARTYDFNFDSVPYTSVFEDRPNGVFILQRNYPVRWSQAVQLSPRITHINGNDEFYELFNDSVNVLPGTEGCFEFSSTIKVDGGLWDAHLVITSYDKNGNGEYDYIPLHWLRPEWNGDALHLKRTYHFADDVQTFKVYFWNMNQQTIELNLSDFTFQIPE